MASFKGLIRCRHLTQALRQMYKLRVMAIHQDRNRGRASAKEGDVIILVSSLPFFIACVV